MNNVDFPALLQKLGYQDQQLREAFPTREDYITNPNLFFQNIWQIPADNPYIKAWRSSLEAIYAAPSPKYDWEDLRESIKRSGCVRNVTLTARMPMEHEVISQVMSGTSPGIYPVRNPDYFRNNRVNHMTNDNNIDEMIIKKATHFVDTLNKKFDPLEQPTGAIRHASEADVDESGLEREYQEGSEDDIPGTEGGWIVKLSNTKEVFDFMNSFQFRGLHSIDNERNETFELEIYQLEDYNEFITQILDELGLNAFVDGIMPSLAVE